MVSRAMGGNDMMSRREVWVTQNQGADVHASYQGVCFVNETTGWAVGAGGCIVGTLDGKNWSIQRPFGRLGSLLDVSFVNQTTGWAVGAGGTILRTTNGGKVWLSQTSPTQDDLWGVCFVDDCTGWIVSQHTILATTDGGTTWANQVCNAPPSPFFSLHDIVFVDKNNGWAVGDGGFLVHTSDGGQTWMGQNSHVGSQKFFDLFGLCFVNSTQGWAVGGGGTVGHPSGVLLHTEDGGQTWVAQNEGNSTPNLWAVSFVNQTNGWAVGDSNTVLFTEDGGVTWRQEDITSSVSDNHIYDVCRYARAVGYGGTILQCVPELSS